MLADKACAAGAKGERLVDKVPQGKWKTATFLAALRNDRIDAATYVEHFLGQAAYSAMIHLKAIRDVGGRLVFLPKYSPDLNPIEQVFANALVQSPANLENLQ